MPELLCCFNREDTMVLTIRAITACAAFIGAVASFANSALSIDLNGVWASDTEVCNKIFDSKGKRTVFRRNSDVHGSGFIIDGQFIRGRAATCKIIKTRKDAEVIHMLSSCATDVMLSNVQLSVKVLDDNKINRIFPGMADMTITYFRCPALRATHRSAR
jgi:hypothetical protein